MKQLIAINDTIKCIVHGDRGVVSKPVTRTFITCQNGERGCIGTKLYECQNVIKYLYIQDERIVVRRRDCPVNIVQLTGIFITFVIDVDTLKVSVCIMIVMVDVTFISDPCWKITPGPFFNVKSSPGSNINIRFWTKCREKVTPKNRLSIRRKMTRESFSMGLLFIIVPRISFLWWWSDWSIEMAIFFIIIPHYCFLWSDWSIERATIFECHTVFTRAKVGQVTFKKSPARNVTRLGRQSFLLVTINHVIP